MLTSFPCNGFPLIVTKKVSNWSHGGINVHILLEF